MFTLDFKPSNFEMFKRTSFSKPDFQEFKKIGLELKVIQTHSGDSHDTYKISFNKGVDVFKAGVVCLEHHVFSNDQAFSQRDTPKTNWFFQKQQKINP